MLRIKNLTFRIGGRTLFEDTSCHVPVGHSVGLTGCNGTGKTTLLQLIMGELEPSLGTVQVQSRATVGIVAQEAPGGDQTPLQAVLAADTRRANLLEEADSCRDPSRIAEIHTKLADLGAHAAPAKAAYILAGLGFKEADQGKPLNTFSGGWRMRVALAGSLFTEPDLLLLDEPTNHLDLESALWLESYLRSYPNTLIMVSHDKNLLNHSVNHILHLENHKLALYTGGFDGFERVRLARLMQNDALRRKQEQEQKRVQAFIDRFRAKATKARQAQSRIKLLERMTPMAAAVTTRTVSFSFPTPLKCPSPLIRLDNATAGYSPKDPVLEDLHLSIFADDRIALLGANGNGKTTLAKLLFGRLSPLSGNIFRSSKVNVGYFAQDQLEQLDPRLKVIEQMRTLMPVDSISAVRGWLGRFGFGEDKIDLLTTALSGGEKTRLALALIAQKKPNLLILDEPTNHLDIDARESLLTALGDFEGAVILISHDRHLIETSADQLWLVESGTAKAFSGDLEDYTQRLLEKRKAKPERKADGQVKVSIKEERRHKAEARARIAPLKNEVKQAEQQLESLTEKKQKIEAELSDPATYTGPKERITTLQKQKSSLDQDLARAEERWLEAEAALEDHLNTEK